MRDLVQAVDDEAVKEQKRETAERSAFERPQALQDLKKVHREDRRLGKQYIQALQRDQEVRLIQIPLRFKVYPFAIPKPYPNHSLTLSSNSDGSHYYLDLGDCFFLILLFLANRLMSTRPCVY